MSRDPRCNCPELRDVLREGMGTKDPCPVHDTPENLALLREAILPMIPLMRETVVVPSTKISTVKPDVSVNELAKTTTGIEPKHVYYTSRSPKGTARRS